MITVGTGHFNIIILVYAIIDNVVMLFQIASIIIIQIPYIYVALFWRLNTFNIEGGISSTTTSVQHLPG